MSSKKACIRKWVWSLSKSLIVVPRMYNKQWYLKSWPMAWEYHASPIYFLLFFSNIILPVCMHNVLIKIILVTEQSCIEENSKSRIFKNTYLLLKNSIEILIFLYYVFFCFLHNLLLKSLFFSIYTPGYKLPQVLFNLNPKDTRLYTHSLIFFFSWLSFFKILFCNLYFFQLPLMQNRLIECLLYPSIFVYLYLALIENVPVKFVLSIIKYTL